MLSPKTCPFVVAGVIAEADAKMNYDTAATAMCT